MNGYVYLINYWTGDFLRISFLWKISLFKLRLKGDLCWFLKNTTFDLGLIKVKNRSNDFDVRVFFIVIDFQTEKKNSNIQTRWFYVREKPAITPARFFIYYFSLLIELHSANTLNTRHIDWLLCISKYFKVFT